MNVQIFKCFIASPGDTNNEREECDNVFKEINDTLGQQLNFRIESKRWEKNARPSFGDDGQAVINEQLLDNYQLFIGIMWNRFGAPTQRAESGTEEEFNQAYDKYLEQGNVEIMMYFNEEPASVSSLDLVQAQKVINFKSKISELGGLYASYTGCGDFKNKLKQHLNDYFVSKLSTSTSPPKLIEEADKIQKIALHESISLILNHRLKNSLTSFLNQPSVWLDPVLSSKNDITQNADDNFNSKIDIKEIIRSPKSLIIKSPPLFGLTSLANYMVKEAWNNESVWVYLDAKTAKRHAITKSVDKELENLNLTNRTVDCIILDSWKSHEAGAKKLLRNLCNEYKDIPIIVMQSIDDVAFRKEDPDENLNREFNFLHLLALPRNQIRKVVSKYNDEKNIGDENLLLDRVIKDLDVLNIHRTALNCLTLLKVSENNFEESPANRTKMIEMVLFVLFNIDDLPTYKTRPDLKDCEYVLGRFCEGLIRNKNFNFNRDDFLKNLATFCDEKLLQLDISVVFDVLYENNIIIKIDNDFIFRASFWIYYFAAKRMYADIEFKNYIFDDHNYINYPEIVEFYTGIDRNRDDVLAILTNDLIKIRETVENKTGLTDDVNPLTQATWNPSEQSLSQMKSDINNEVMNSKLPDSVKDKYADASYNQLTPYNQSVRSILAEYSFPQLIKNIKASSRALRNSDYVEPNVKRVLLKEITFGWKQISKVLFALTPLLAENGKVAYEGQGFILDGNFGDTVQKKTVSIFEANPVNVVNMFKHDLYANKMGPLLFDGIQIENDPLIKHQLILLLISERPLEWRSQIERYVESLTKNSFYLYDTMNSLQNMYRYSFASNVELNEISHLIKMCIAKHEFGSRKPNLKEMKKVSNHVIPTREVTAN